MSDTVFQTPRLLCRRWRAEDFEVLYAVYSDPVAMRWVGDGKPITREQCQEWFKVTETNYAKRGYGMFTLIHAQSDSVVGFAGLVHPGGQSEPEVKYALLQSHWGLGLATEAVAALLSCGAREHRLVRVVATVAPGNLASQRVLAKVGMALAQQRRNDDGSTTNLYEWRAPSAA